jgi:hypothetical protein
MTCTCKYIKHCFSHCNTLICENCLRLLLIMCWQKCIGQPHEWLKCFIVCQCSTKNHGLSKLIETHKHTKWSIFFLGSKGGVKCDPSPKWVQSTIILDQPKIYLLFVLQNPFMFIFWTGFSMDPRNITETTSLTIQHILLALVHNNLWSRWVY